MFQKQLRQVSKLILTRSRSRPINSKGIILKTHPSFFAKYFQSTLARHKQLMPFQSMNTQKNWPRRYRNSHIQS